MKYFYLVIAFLMAIMIQEKNFLIQAMEEVEGEIEESMEARVFLYKHTETNPVVEGKDFVISYQLVNTGNGVATGIELKDRYDPNSFETVSNVDAEGIVSYELDELTPGSSTTFNVTVRPKLFGIYESTRARIKYNNGMILSAEEEPEVKHGYSSSLGRIRIISAAEHARNTEYFLKQWLVFFALYGVAVVGPFVLWQKSRQSKSAKSAGKKKSN